MIFLGFSTFLFAKEKYYIPLVQEKFVPTKDNRELGYQLVDWAKKVVFVFDMKAYKYESVAKVYVEGSFNGWAKGSDDSWRMSESSKKGIYILEKDFALVNIPGNSGYPEFKFYIYRKPNAYSADEPGSISKKPGFSMSTNNLILLPEDSAQEVQENVKLVASVKKLSDFNLENAQDRAVISNVRLVPGTVNLYRGYHPYKKSRSQYDTEEVRIELVKKSLEENDVHSIITLSGKEDAVEKLNEAVCLYQQNIIDSGNNLFINTHYNTVYYKSDSQEYGNLVAEIVRFINTHPGAYYIHCRLGTDRTGTMSAVLAALCGASWKEIAEDYQKTNLMGIKEFRDYRLLKYSFEKILGKSMENVEDLKTELCDYFIKNDYLNQNELDVLAKRLTNK